MVQVAHAAARTRDSKLRRFYLRIKARKGAKTAIVALARKMLTIIHHLLINGEECVEEGFKKRRTGRRPAHFKGISLEEMAVVLRDAGYVASRLIV